MKTISDVRRENLAILIEEHGSQAKFAAFIDRSPAQVSQWLNASADSKTGKPRVINNQSARYLEEKCGKPNGWLDQAHGTRTPSANRENVEPGPDIRGLVPLISWVQAGNWEEAIDNGYPHDGGEGLYACPVSHGMHTYALRVRGDSMTAPHGRSFPEDVLIFVDPDQAGGVVSGDPVIAKVSGDNAVTFKIFVEDAGRKFLKPLNPQHPPITDEFKVLGKVIGAWMDV